MLDDRTPQQIAPGAYRYGAYAISYNPKPIPDHRFDWDWVHDDYDGPESDSNLSGTSASLDDAVEDIEAIWDDEDYYEDSYLDDDYENEDEDDMTIESLEILAKSDPTLFAEAIKKYGFQMVGIRESDPLQTQVQEELVVAMASAITESIDENAELTVEQQTVYQLAEQYGYIVQVI